MKAGLLISVAVLLTLAFSDSVTESHVDFVESLSQANLPLLERVEHKAEINYTFSLSGDNKYNKYPDLDITFNLPFDQYVKVKYITTCYSCGVYPCQLTTHLVVDGKENRDFRDCEYQTYTLRTSGYGEIFLKAGTHRIYVEYATIAQLPNYYSWEWPTNMMSVQYHRRITT